MPCTKADGHAALPTRRTPTTTSARRTEVPWAHYDKAFDEFRLALPRCALAGDTAGDEAITLDNIGLVRHDGDGRPPGGAARRTSQAHSPFRRELSATTGWRPAAHRSGSSVCVHGGLGDWGQGARALHGGSVSHSATPPATAGARDPRCTSPARRWRQLGRAHAGRGQLHTRLARHPAGRAGPGPCRQASWPRWRSRPADREAGTAGRGTDPQSSRRSASWSRCARDVEARPARDLPGHEHNVARLDVDVSRWDLDRARAAGLLELRGPHAALWRRSAPRRAASWKLLQEGRVDLRAGVEAGPWLEREPPARAPAQLEEALYRTRLLGGVAGRRSGLPRSRRRWREPLRRSARERAGGHPTAQPALHAALTPPPAADARTPSRPCSTTTRCCWSTRWARSGATCGLVARSSPARTSVARPRAGRDAAGARVHHWAGRPAATCARCAALGGAGRRRAGRDGAGAAAGRR